MSVRIVMDASAAVRLVMGLDTDGSLAAALREAGVVIAPGIFAAEVANALRGYEAAGAIERREAIARLEESLHLVDELVPDAEMAVEALGEAMRTAHPVYDLQYAVLARRSGAALLTRDGRLGELAEQLGIPLIPPAPAGS